VGSCSYRGTLDFDWSRGEQREKIRLTGLKIMSTWLAIPSKRPLYEVVETLALWREMGYKIALLRDPGEGIQCDLLLEQRYPGYGAAINTLASHVFAADPDADWIVTGGDDTLPDSAFSAQAIADQCTEHFHGTFGVMQPTGDGHGIDTICGSPWLGREFCRRMYGGRGPYWEEYRHLFDDTELQQVALKLGVLWQRPDLTHKHNHWSWTGKPMPEFLQEANSIEHWNKNEALFKRRSALGFPGHEPLPLD
jgi:hypothetical protein